MPYRDEILIRIESDVAQLTGSPRRVTGFHADAVASLRGVRKAAVRMSASPSAANASHNGQSDLNGSTPGAQEKTGRTDIHQAEVGQELALRWQRESPHTGRSPN